jgi:NAD(P) transhydrogenase subunit beta
MGVSILTICYLVASVTFILGLKMLSSSATAFRGNQIAAAGMAIAIFGTIFLYEEDGVALHNYGWIFSGLIIGGIAGTFAARKVKMTAMPEMVSLFNGMGGACAMLISVIEFQRSIHGMITSDADSAHAYFAQINGGMLFIIMLGMIIGSVSFAGSVIAWGKLNGSVKDIAFRGQHFMNLIILAILTGVTIYILVGRPGMTIELFYTVLTLSLLYGIFFVLPIGGADMPVVISLLNSFTGVAAACGGFLYNNKAMLTGGILVGAAGTLLTILMCKAMNRSLTNVLIGSFGGGSKTSDSAQKDQGHYKEISIGDAAMIMNYAQKVIIVPGYGLAVAQAQHTCHELENMLTAMGVDVKYAIHPVAGRMPGHMNVLLAEANISDEKMLEMETANEEFPTTDVVLILGANDVVNPAAEDDPSSPIYGMPILKVGLAKTVIMNKRSMRPGYAGIDNDLFFQPKTSMLFGDAKKVLQDVIAELKNLQ